MIGSLFFFNNSLIRLVPLLSAMEQLLHSPQSFILLLITLTVVLVTTKAMAQQVPSFDSRFTKVNPGDGVTGDVEVTHSSVTLDECIVR